MGVQVQQAKKITSTKKVNDHFGQATSNLSAEEREAVDRLVEITMEMKKYEAIITEGGKLKERLASLAADKDRFKETEVVTLRGDAGVVEFSAAKDARSIVNKNGLIGLLKTKLGYDKLVEVLKIGLGDADKYLSENELAPFIETGKGSRSCTSIRVKDA